MLTGSGAVMPQYPGAYPLTRDQYILILCGELSNTQIGEAKLYYSDIDS